MEGTDVCKVLRSKKIHNLYHANTVTTSCTFLQFGGLASRGLVTKLGLPQTPQDSDEIDKKYNVWFDIFVDTDDIHQRAHQPNEYGPILFTVPVDILNSLPNGSDVLVTKDNPIYWPGKTPEEQFFTTIREIDSFLQKGTFAQMIVIKTPKGILSFPEGKVSILIDDPQRKLSNGISGYEHALSRIQPGAKRLSIPTIKRACRSDCKCVELYKKFTVANLERYFK